MPRAIHMRGEKMFGGDCPGEIEPTRRTLTRERIELAKAEGRKIFLTSDPHFRDDSALQKDYPVEKHSAAIAELTRRLEGVRASLDAFKRCERKNDHRPRDADAA